MTAQFHNLFRHNGKEYSIVAHGSGLFQPADFQLSPIPASTACWLGYLTLYTTLDSHLMLDTLWANLREPTGPAINGITPSGRAKRYTMFNNVYKNLNLPMAYTGGITIATYFIQELYEHMGFHPAWKYRIVIELMFENGKWIHELDRSEDMAQYRLTMQKKK